MVLYLKNTKNKIKNNINRKLVNADTAKKFI